MKITKTQLRKIIKEEVSKVLSEEMSPMEQLDHTIKIIEDYVKQGVLTQAMLNDALKLKEEPNSLTTDKVEEMSRRLQRNVDQYYEYDHLG